MQKLQLEGITTLGTDSNGNQSKVWVDSKHLVKINSKRRESSKEVDAYRLGTAMGLNCAKYREIEVGTSENKRKACITESFLEKGDIEVPVAEMLEGVNISINLSAVEYINITVKCIHEYTGIRIEAIYKWIYDMLVFDYIICNEDRHLKNFEVIYNSITNKFRLAPYYDHGNSFLNTEGILTKVEFEKRVRRLKSKPFSSNPDRNIGDYTMAKRSLDIMICNVGGIQGIRSIGLKSSHLQTVIRRIERLSRG